MIHNNHSPMMEKLRKGEMVLSVKANVPHPFVAELAAYSGADVLWLDMEHVPCDYSEVRNAMYAALARGMETVVRTTRGCYSNMCRPLEMDCAGIMVPHCMSKEDAEYIGHYTKFHPRGRRPIDGGNADGMYCLMDVPEYLRYSNEEKLTIIQIEDVEAMADLDEIAAVPGIDMLFFGPADFAHSLGIPENTADPRIEEARIAVAQAALRHGKYAGTVGGPGSIKHLYDLGYRFVNIAADVVGIANVFKNAVDGANAALEG